MLYHNLSLELLGHDSIRIITAAPTKYIYFDPYQLATTESLPKADYLFITHTHQDHCSIEDIRKIVKPETIIITVPDALSKLSKLVVQDIKLLKPGMNVALPDVDVMVVPAYNTNKFRSEGLVFHPQENEWVGFIITLQGTTVYVAGDTDLIPEMNTFPPIDIAFLPVSGTYVMTAEEAAKAASSIKPKVAIPMHYGSLVGTLHDAERFCTLTKDVRTEIIKK